MGAVGPSAKAVILKDNQLLLTRNLKPAEDNEEFWLLPGGGQDLQEDLAEAVQREVAEETGLTVDAGRLLRVRDYIDANHAYSTINERLNQERALELMFECKVVGVELGRGHKHDPGQLAVEWVPIENLADTRLFPKVLVELVTRIVAGGDPGSAYLADVN